MHYGYTYIITFLDTGHYYIGKRLCPKGKTPWTDNYWGSSKTHKKEFKSNRPKHKLIKDIIYDNNRELVNKKIIELEYIWHKETNCLNDLLSYNENVGSGFSIEVSKKSGKKLFEQKKGIFNPKYRNSRKYIEDHKKSGKASGLNNFKNKIGIFGFSQEKKIENQIKATKRNLELLANKRKTIWNKKHYENLFNLYNNRTSQHWGLSKYCKENNLDIKVYGNIARYIKKGLSFEEATSP